MNEIDFSSNPTTIVIFGASGDLTQRKLIPALYNNHKKQRLPGFIRIVGVARKEWTNEQFKEKLLDGVKQYTGDSFNEDVWDSFANNIWYLKANLEIADDYRSINNLLKGIEGGNANRLYYLATAPELYAPACMNLAEAGMTIEEKGWRRIIIEKPFGENFATARELNKVVLSAFRENQVYRIDHYLGKETAQNLLFLRFANTIFEPVWNRRYVSNIQITVAETVDIGHRAGYYDKAGVLRDMFQNHLLQLMTLATMEPPASLDADAIRNEKDKILQAVRPILATDTIRGQYEGYLETEGVSPGSQTPTYAALKLFIDNWRWKDVPIYLRSGKSMTEKSSYIVVVFQKPPDVMFNLGKNECFTPNMISICIQPHEGIHLRFETKIPDTVNQSQSVYLDFEYQGAFGDTILPDAYERLLLDAMKGDASLFGRSDGIEHSWKLIDPIHEHWLLSPGVSPLVTYETGSWGPLEADELLARDGHTWQTGCNTKGCLT